MFFSFLGAVVLAVDFFVLRAEVGGIVCGFRMNAGSYLKLWRGLCIPLLLLLGVFATRVYARDC